MNKTAFVLAYVNPDTDGVCTSVGYAYWRSKYDGRIFTPVIFGEIGKETLFVLNHFKVGLPNVVSDLPRDSELVLVDTHHVNQLPHNIVLANVTEIIDHHPSGDADSFPNAKIDNQLVGAAATLITERLRDISIEPDASIAGILSLAIISNTLNFTAPSARDRDKSAMDWLQHFVSINDSTIQEMFAARSDLSGLSTAEILASDFKEFTIGNIKIGISQIETTSVDDLLLRKDITVELENLRVAHTEQHILLNVVDIIRRRSIIIVTDERAKHYLSNILNEEFDGNLAIANRILLRKTDFVPKLDWFLFESM